MLEFIVIKSGLFFNIVGAIMISCSIGPNRGGAYQEHKGKPYYLAAILHPNIFKCGMALLIIGFILSFLDTIILGLVVTSPQP